MSEKVCAVIVTHNRKDLLMDCIDSILSQTRQVEGICIIDNNSTDGTPKILFEKGLISKLPPEVLSQPWMIDTVIQNASGRETFIHYIRNNVNTGGAGGFNLGIKKAFKHGYDCFWLMDDDVYADNEALSCLLEGYRKINEFEPMIGFLCSHTMWIDGKPHLMNLPQPALPFAIGAVKNSYNTYIEKGIIMITLCSFVSCLIHKRAIMAVGLPIKEMFLYGDDLEYIDRIFMAGFCGLYVTNSKVTHRTKYNDIVKLKNLAGNEIKKIYFAIRNNMYINKRRGILFTARFIFLDVIKHLRDAVKNRDLKALLYVIRGAISGLFFSPIIEKIDDN